MKKHKSSSFLSGYVTEAKGLLLLALTFLSLLSFISYNVEDQKHNWMGIVGNGYAWILIYLFGVNVYIILAFTGWLGWKWLLQEKISFFKSKLLYLAIFLFSFSTLLSWVAEQGIFLPTSLRHKIFIETVESELPFNLKSTRHNLGGVPFYYLYRDLPNFNLRHLLSDVGVIITFSLTTLLSACFLTEFWPFYSSRDSRKKEIQTKEGDKKKSLLSLSIPPLYENKKKLQLHIRTPQDEETVKKIIKIVKEPSTYQLPPVSLLTNAKKIDQPSLKKELRRQAELLEISLKSFGIEAKVKDISCGPTITSFEVHPAIGVKVQKITALENDLALKLEAKSIRMIAPIPGKAAIGIEVPAPYPQEVNFKEMMVAYQQSHRKLRIPIILGKTVTGEHVIADLTQMPHCLIAGATGSGKSVCINTIIMSILMNARPDEVKLILIDPKKVELTPYMQIPHLLAPVITEPQGAYSALNWMVKEMLRRYDLLKQFGLRNIEAFNSRQIDRDFEASFQPSEGEIPEKLPLLVGIIDEFADLMMASSADLETPVARIAQMARAVGIHLILATQRPSREVITGLIKANFPTRIAFKVSSRVNSQIILDENGAETLLGNGDQLFRPPGSSHLIRTQNTYVSDGDINKIVDFICHQAPPNYLISSFESAAPFSHENPSQDDLYHQAKTIVIQTQNASTTFLQRKLKIGYPRAASLIDELETDGVISAPSGSKPRKVLIKHDL